MQINTSELQTKPITHLDEQVGSRVFAKLDGIRKGPLVVLAALIVRRKYSRYYSFSDRKHHLQCDSDPPGSAQLLQLAPRRPRVF